ncbi:MAG TPA: asparagine synthase-related protein, partial [Allosphingosinicella sp.]|nr:asparagine synthase-related protein [Allosphingosinicella sp.]
MAGLFLVQAREPHFAEHALAAARRQFLLHGFSDLSERQLAGWHLLHAPHIAGGPESLLVQGNDLVAVAGTFTCDGLMGRPALKALLAMTSLPALDWSRLGGQFVALVHKRGRTFLFTDYFGAFQLFHDNELRFFSTSFLSAAKALPSLRFDPQAVYEFAFNVVPIGDDTLFSDLKMLGPDRLAELGEGGALLHDLRKPLPDKAVEMPLQERIKSHREQLSAVVRRHIAASSKVNCALSGGLDSRLVLAALRAEGCQPGVFVYGAPDSEDVRTALEIGRAQGFHVDWLHKENYRIVEPDGFSEQVERNFHEYDALPNFGALFDNGGNAAARDARFRDGALSASGGCGEIYRNFFFLADRPMSASAVARTFFARYALGDVTQAFDEGLFLRRIEDKILAALGAPGVRSPLPRGLIEQAYPRVRCRSGFGREISLEGRYGAYLMPFLDHQVVAEAMTLPMSLKNAGKFEATLINSIDPELARQPSTYGHDFSGPPSLGHRFSEWSTRARPVWLRQKSYALQRRLRPMQDEHEGLLSPNYLKWVIDLDYPAMRRFFRPERITDTE